MTTINSDNLLRLLTLLVDDMEPDIGADGYSSVSAEQREARRLLGEMKQSVEQVNSGPINPEHYHPQESPPMYPLELDERLHINLWSENGEYKWTIAMWVDDKEGCDLRFLGDRPFDPRVNGQHLEIIARQGQVLADKRYESRHSDSH